MNLYFISQYCAEFEHSQTIRLRHQLKAALLILDWFILLGVAIGSSRYLPYRWNPIENGNILYGIIIFFIATGGFALLILPLVLIRNMWLHCGIFLVILSLFCYTVGFFEMWGWV